MDTSDGLKAKPVLLHAPTFVKFFCPTMRTCHIQFQVHRCPEQSIWLTETRELRLLDESQEQRNRSWAVEEFSATFQITGMYLIDIARWLIFHHSVGYTQRVAE
ncbi:hypothetical protein CSKR_114042 [Clonorchis sinensis]|uniref:Uncharacterized protein n=1 Tax=Clonorchis sinensis TaxID=79923 RepID=A0A419PSX1_CLOSI|nr:hypothetical protein CSKR_114042 [Clonorchis sinensis]